MRFPSSVGGERAEEVGFIEHDTVELATWYAGAIDLVDVSGDYRWSSVRDLVRDLPIAPGGVTRGGRWSFSTFGEPFEFEDLDAYRRRRTSDRFTREMLAAYLTALGAPIDDEPEWPKAIVLKDRWAFAQR